MESTASSSGGRGSKITCGASGLPLQEFLHSASKIPLALFLSILTTAGVPIVLTLWLTSSMSQRSSEVYMFLGAAGHESRTPLFVGTIIMGMCLRLTVYLLDLRHHFVIYCFCRSMSIIVIVFGVLGLTPYAPSIPVVTGLALAALAVSLLRSSCQHVDVEVFSITVGLAATTLALGIVVVWGLWAFNSRLFGLHGWTSELVTYRAAGFKATTAFVMWSAPLIVAFGLALAAAFSILRSQFHLPAEGDVVSDVERLQYIQGELRCALLCLVFAFACLWAAASVGARSIGLSHVVLRLGLFSLLGVSSYLLFSVGLGRIMVEAERSATIQETGRTLSSDWVKAALLLVGWPLLPLYFAFEALHQRLRSLRPAEPHRARKEARLWEFPEPAWLAREARGLWLNVVAWQPASVLSKAAYLGLLVFGVQVGTSQLLPLFLSALNHHITAWPLPAILATLWCVGMMLFMMPPVPGLPIYLLTGVVVTERCALDGMSFQWTCLICILFGYFMKASACVIQMTLIGRQFTTSVAVKKAIQVHTSPMRAARYILSKKGLFHVDKVAVLCGGPDWPTFVIAGIMGHSVPEMLLGGSPVILMIVPFVLTSAFSTQAHHEKDASMQEFYSYISSICALASSLVLMLYMTLAGYFLQRCCDKHAEDLQGNWLRDEQEDEVLASIAQEEQLQRRRDEALGWRVMPVWLRSVLIASACLSSLCTCIIVVPLPAEPFVRFALTDSIESLPGGHWWGIVNRLGFWALTFFFGSLCGVIAFQLWSASQDIKTEPTEERRPLLRKDTMGGKARDMINWRKATHLDDDDDL